MEASSLRQSSSAYYKVVESMDVPTTSKNPQAKAKCERIHLQVGNVLRTLLHGQQPPHLPGTRTEKELIDEESSITLHAMRTGTYSTLGS